MLVASITENDAAPAQCRPICFAMRWYACPFEEGTFVTDSLEICKKKRSCLMKFTDRRTRRRCSVVDEKLCGVLENFIENLVEFLNSDFHKCVIVSQPSICVCCNGLLELGNSAIHTLSVWHIALLQGTVHQPQIAVEERWHQTFQMLSRSHPSREWSAAEFETRGWTTCTRTDRWKRLIVTQVEADRHASSPQGTRRACDFVPAKRWQWAKTLSPRRLPVRLT